MRICYYASMTSYFLFQNINGLNPDPLELNLLRRLLMAISPSDGDFKPGRVMVIFDKSRVMLASGFFPTLLHFTSIIQTLHHNKTTHRYSYP